MQKTNRLYQLHAVTLVVTLLMATLLSMPNCSTAEFCPINASEECCPSRQTETPSDSNPTIPVCNCDCGIMADQLDRSSRAAIPSNTSSHDDLKFPPASNLFATLETHSGDHFRWNVPAPPPVPKQVPAYIIHGAFLN